jgi:hypothetical protein
MRTQLRVDRDDAAEAALCRLAVVRTADEKEIVRDVDVIGTQAEDLALPEPGIQRNGEDLAPRRVRG